MGTQTLSNKLTKILYTHIKYNLPEIVKEISERIQEVSDRLKELGPPLPEAPSEKLQMAWIMIMQFCSYFRDAIAGKSSTKKDRSEKQKREFQGGAKIKIMYYKLYDKYSRSDFKITEEEKYDDDAMSTAILLSEGDSMSGFPSADVFVSLIQPQIEKLKAPALELLADVYGYLEGLANNLKEKAFRRFPSFGEELMEKISEVMQNEREKCRYLVEALLDSEHEYMFTNDAEYLMNRTNIVPEAKEKTEEIKEERKGSLTSEDKKMEPVASFVKKKEKKEIMSKKKTTKIFVTELRARLDTYFRIVIRNMRDAIPKIIGFFLVKAVQEKMQLELFQKMSEMHEAINRNLGEPIAVIKERKALTAQLEILRKAERALSRDPEITSATSAIDEELLYQLKAEKASELLKAKNAPISKDSDRKRSDNEMPMKLNEEQKDIMPSKSENVANPKPVPVQATKSDPVKPQMQIPPEKIMPKLGLPQIVPAHPLQIPMKGAPLVPQKPTTPPMVRKGDMLPPGKPAGNSPSAKTETAKTMKSNGVPPAKK